MKTQLEKSVNIGVYLLQIIASIVFIYMLYTIHFIPMNYIIILAVVLCLLSIGEYFLIFYKKQKSKRSIITQIMSVFLSVVCIVGSTYVYKMGEVVDLLTDEVFQKRAISIIVLEDSSIRNDHQLPQHSLGYISSIDTTTMKYATNDITENIGDIEFVDCKDFKELVDSLYSKKVDGIILDEAFRHLIEQEKESFSDDTRVIYQIIKDEDSVNAKSVDVLNKPFLVFISGNDMYGEITTISRSDVNMLAAINPLTHQVLLISIPRDTYYPLNRNGQYDKFTHAGIYGLQESIDTLEDMLSEDINYYVRMNFTSFINIVDALGGITVYSPSSFTTRIGKYNIEEGENTLNAKQALAFVRERKSFIDGDFARGRNQQRMIAAIIDKICSPAILTSFSSVLDTISQSVETNFSSTDINALVQMQLTQMPSWDIQTYQIIGDPAMKPCYSSGGVEASVVIPYSTSIDKAREYIDLLMAGETIQTEAGNLNKEEVSE
ncbi:MAG: LCP family protein [Erysipelotrichales bacterium]|nr:LCP family protein [Erysipelotrichales bacterium]